MGSLFWTFGSVTCHTFFFADMTSEKQIINIIICINQTVLIKCFTAFAKYQRGESVILSDYNVTFFGDIGNFAISRVRTLINNNSFCSVFFNGVGVVTDNGTLYTSLFGCINSNIYNRACIGINYYFNRVTLN
jgi:hypothetical protein